MGAWVDGVRRGGVAGGGPRVDIQGRVPDHERLAGRVRAGGCLRGPWVVVGRAGRADEGYGGRNCLAGSEGEAARCNGRFAGADYGCWCRVCCRGVKSRVPAGVLQRVG